MSFSPIAWAVSENMSSTFWDNLRISSVEVYGSGYTCMILESYKKKYPTREIMSTDMLHLKTAACPAYQRKFSMGVPTIANMTGAALLTCPMPWRGGLRGRDQF